eukprot:gene8548-5994_t
MHRPLDFDLHLEATTTCPALRFGCLPPCLINCLSGSLPAEVIRLIIPNPVETPFFCFSSPKPHIRNNKFVNNADLTTVPTTMFRRLLRASTSSCISCAAPVSTAALLGPKRSREVKRGGAKSPLSPPPPTTAGLSAKEVEERDVRVAIRHVLTQHHMQTVMDRRKQRWEVEERKESERAALEALERELKRQEQLLTKQPRLAAREVAEPSPSALVGAYAAALSRSKTDDEGGHLPPLSLADLQRLHHHIKLRRRQEEKERNAERLCGPSGTAGVDGVLPVAVPDHASGWRRPNRLGEAASLAAAPGGNAAAKTFSLEPDLSVYSLDGDVRISSERVVLQQRQELERQYRSSASPSTTPAGEEDTAERTEGDEDYLASMPPGGLGREARSSALFSSLSQHIKSIPFLRSLTDGTQLSSSSVLFNL